MMRIRRRPPRGTPPMPDLPPVTGDQLVELDIPARAEYLALARLVVAAAADIDPLFVAERIDALRLAVSEAATNAVESYHGRGDGERIIIRCNLGAEQIAVEVADQGVGFDPEDVVGLEGEPLMGREGGFGLRLIRSVADESQILPGPDGTAVRIVVYTHPQDDES